MKKVKTEQGVNTSKTTYLSEQIKALKQIKMFTENFYKCTMFPFKTLVVMNLKSKSRW